MRKRSNAGGKDASRPEKSRLDQLTEEEVWQKALGEGKNPAAVMLGRLGGLKGGKARAERLSPEKRKEIARNAALMRWQQEE